MNVSEQIESLFPPKSDSPRGWGLFGYEGSMCERAIGADRPDMIAEAVARGWINDNSTTMMGESIHLHCIRKGAVKCAAKLLELGVGCK